MPLKDDLWFDASLYFINGKWYQTELGEALPISMPRCPFW